ncbi:hypothetical protein CEQ90_02750 [Lewinellaceae bacterium SD302]|nr:hypothetical protein CEQ90_02750 [Lewinellaceae bacterium SD302]
MNQPTSPFRVFGIRHHGPGSSRRLKSVLKDWHPDCVLIEGPADGQPATAELVKMGMEPPVALVLYNEKNIEQAAYLPFAAFSPEYLAIRWAIQHEISYELIDLPATNFLVPAEEKEQLSLFASEQAPTLEELTIRRLRKDPLSLLAETAGYTDSERWWDAAVERSGGADDAAVFSAILEAVKGLRDAYPTAADTETLRREAFMRVRLRAAIKAGHERIAVIVGAWHAPALADLLDYKVTADKALLKGLPKTKVKAAWVPWSYPRLARNSGYGAGVVAPAWYEWLYRNPESATEHWMVAAAQLLRKEGFAASPALAADAVNLARSLAGMRNQAFAGTDELDDALLSTLAAGHRERLNLIRERLTIGLKVGKVPPGNFTVPLLADLQKELKSTRLTKHWEAAGEHYLKATKTKPRGGIDLRQDNDLRKSHLLHRLDLLGIPWGKMQPINANAISSFQEIWLLEWQPEFSLLITERSSYGNTLPLAAGKYSLQKASDSHRVDVVAELILASLRADLPEIVPALVRKLRDLATKSADTATLLATLPTLVSTTRYGDSRKTDTTALLLLVEELIPRIAAGIPAAATNIDYEQARILLEQIARADYAIGQLAGSELTSIWQGGLGRLVEQNGTAPSVAGLALRLLYDQQILDEQATSQHFHYALSPTNGPLNVAEWIGGFLHGSAQLLLHFPPLWKLVSQWVAGLAWEEFELALPLLRRTLTDFKPEEKRSLFKLVGQAGPEKKSDEPLPTTALTEEKAAPAAEELLAALRGWMG